MDVEFLIFTHFGFFEKKNQKLIKKNILKKFWKIQFFQNIFFFTNFLPRFFKVFFNISNMGIYKYIFSHPKKKNCQQIFLIFFSHQNKGLHPSIFRTNPFPGIWGRSRGLRPSTCHSSQRKYPIWSNRGTS